MKLHVIRRAKPYSDTRIRVDFDEDDNALIDLAALLAQGGVFKPLRDPARFAAVEVGPRGRTLVWRIGDEIVDLCADALWLMAHPEDRAATVAPSSG
jgi:hypothetical protein